MYTTILKNTKTKKKGILIFYSNVQVYF